MTRKPIKFTGSFLESLVWSQEREGFGHLSLQMPLCSRAGWGGQSGLGQGHFRLASDRQAY